MRRLGALLRPLRTIAGAVGTTRRTVAALPDVVDAILVLPTLARRLEAVEFQTATLPEMHAEVVRMRRDTDALPHIDETLGRMAVLLERVDANTAAVQQLADVALPLSGAAVRVGRFADRIPQRGAPRRFGRSAIALPDAARGRAR